MARNPQDNIAILHRFVEEVLNTGDLSRVEDMVSEDFARHDAVRVENGTEEVKQFLKERHDEYEGLQYTLHQTIAHGDYVAATLTARGRHRATGHDVTGSGMVLVRFQDGKVAEVVSEWDRSGMPAGS